MFKHPNRDPEVAVGSEQKMHSVEAQADWLQESSKQFEHFQEFLDRFHQHEHCFLISCGAALEVLQQSLRQSWQSGHWPSVIHVFRVLHDGASW